MKRTSLKRKTALKARTPLKGQKRPLGASKDTKHGKVAKPKANRVKTLKKKLWIIFSQYIRKREADHAGYVTCCDSLERKLWTETHCGHLWHNSERNAGLGGNELWYYENNFAPQSADGNIFNKDDAAKKYMFNVIEKYGKEEVDKMYKMKQTYRLWTEEELQEKYEYYKSQFEKL